MLNFLTAIAMIVAFLLQAGLIIMSVCAWITHVAVCIKTASWILLLFGCVVFPVGIIHGVGVWLGVF